MHGNLPALEAVTADARAAGAESFLLGGDYVVFGARPRETVARLRELDAVAIRGNTDRWLEDASDAPEVALVTRSLAWCGDQLGPGLAHELATMAETERLDRALLCHATPRSDMATFAPDRSAADDELLSDDDPEVIVFGHSHLQFRRPGPHGTHLLNPGSVGMPLDGDVRAAWAVRRDDGEFEFRRAEYDVERAAAGWRTLGSAFGEMAAGRVMRGRD